MLIVSVLPLILSYGTFASACSNAEVSESSKSYRTAEDRFAVGELSRKEVAEAKTAFYFNQACAQVQTKQVNCQQLSKDAESMLEVTIEKFKIGEANRKDIADAALRVSVSGMLCY